MRKNVSKKIGDEIDAGKIAADKNGDYPTALEHFRSALNLAQQNSFVEREAYILSRIGVVHKAVGEYSEATKFLEKALVFKEYLSIDDLVYIYRHRAEIYVSLNDPEKALVLLHHALDILDDPRNGTQMGQVLSSIGNIYLQMLNYVKAIEYSARSLECFRNAGDDFGVMRMLGNLANVYNLHNDKAKAEQYCAEMLAASEDFDRPYDKGQANIIAASIHNENNNIDKAREYAEKVLNIGRQHGISQLTAQALEMLMTVQTKGGELDQALKYGLEAEQVAERIGRKFRLVWIYKRLSDLFVLKGNYESAYGYLNKYTGIKEELTQSDHQRAIAEMQARYDHQQLERESERLRSEMEHRENEIALQAGNIVQQQELLSKVLKDLGELNVQADSRQQLQSTIKLIESHIQQTPSWNLFEQHFKYVHADFIPTLVSRYPSLSPTETKVCALTRLNLDTKTIAAILCISHRTVQNHRINIRKKLGINGDDDLAQFLIQIKAS